MCFPCEMFINLESKTFWVFLTLDSDTLFIVNSKSSSSDAILCLEPTSIYSDFKIFRVNLFANSQLAICARSLFISFCKLARLLEENEMLVSSA